ncbi:TIGR03085 family metal-binding protein [Geodermatophilus sp. YIM 151500]|uniref:TIGR03085 family metal-binding protein n=1 Tax=Geodermatophilus sp. YIM 151500 TaxID=2984531 RepID=UPI0021E372AC|nr:TIGR03085 family metal-binding protein [Geodermatophilus sp. YIM 151500]MCV2491701.1 TIGR03085 family metal-binding protein [Geodermatophilus sp. YIM 151500]
MGDSSLAARERAALADLLDRLGPDAPTRCAGWRTAHLAAHVVVRDSRPDAMPGFALEGVRAARRLTDRAHALEDRLRASLPYAELVARVRSGPPAWSPVGWPVLAGLVNTVEFAIHHEDVRRAQREWEPRVLPRADQDRLWREVAVFGRAAAGRAPGALVLARSDAPDQHRRFGSGPVTTVRGEPLELLLWAGGRRDAARVDVT